MRTGARFTLPKPPPGWPPLWLAASMLAAGIAVAFGVVRWANHFISDPNAEDFRIRLVTARVGLKYGWSHIYDIDLQKAASAGLGREGSLVDSMHLFISPPPAAWVVAPLAPLPISTGYLVWTIINLAAVVVAWRLVVQGSLPERITVILVSLALWPMHYQFWLGQTLVVTLALLAVSWWLLDHEHWVGAGILIALSLLFKPQDALLVPVALLVSGRWKPVAACVVTGVLVGGVCVATLGPTGLAGWLRDIALVRADPHTAPLTYSFIVGSGPLTTGLEIALGLGALSLAWYRRDRLDLVLALGLVGSTASATYLHEDDIAILVLAAWLVMRSRPSATQKVWLVAGIAAAQLIAIGQPIPMLVWEPVWIALLGLEPHLKRLESRPEAVRPGSTSAKRAVP